MRPPLRADQARLRLAFVGGVPVEERKYSQSTFGHSSTQLTFPPDSRSMATASTTEHGRDPYATLVKCPAVVSQRSAKSRRASKESDFQNGLNSMPDYHHTVVQKATPFSVLTKWCLKIDNSLMDNKALAETRRQNLIRYVATRFNGERSRLSRLIGYESDSYINDLLNPNSGKSFGEKAARKIEEKAGLLRGQLDVQDSPLWVDNRRWAEIQDSDVDISDLSKEELARVHALLIEIRSARKGKHRRLAR